MKHFSIIFVFVFILVLVVPSAVFGAEFTDEFSSVSEPVDNFMDMLRKVDVEKGDSNSLFEGASSIGDRVFSGGSSSAIGSDIAQIWADANAWMESRVGVSLREVVSVVGGFIIWLLEFVLKLLKLGLEYVSV